MIVRSIPLAGEEDEPAIREFAASAPNAHFTQHPGWTRLPHADPRGSWVRVVLGEGPLRATALVRIRPLPWPGLTCADIFRGPTAQSPGALADCLRALPQALAPWRAAAIRVDPYWSGQGAGEVAADLSRLGYRPMESPPWHCSSLEIPLDHDDELLLGSFKPATRRQVRKALRAGIEIREGLDAEGAAAFARLYAEMAGTKGASSRPPGFFAGLADCCARFPSFGFVLASWDGPELLGAISVFTMGRRAIYAFGASSLARPEIPKSHLLHFEAMRRARTRGCAVYDFGGFSQGVGEEGSRTATQKINFFKSGFGGRPVDFVAGHELVLKPLPWRILRSLDWIRRRWSRSDGAPPAPVPSQTTEAR